MPLVIAANGPKSIRLAIERGDGWMTYGGTADTDADWWALVARHSHTADEALDGGWVASGIRHAVPQPRLRADLLADERRRPSRTPSAARASSASPTSSPTGRARPTPTAAPATSSTPWSRTSPAVALMPPRPPHADRRGLPRLGRVPLSRLRCRPPGHCHGRALHPRGARLGRAREDGRGAGAAVRRGAVHRGPRPHPRHAAQRHRDRRGHLARASRRATSTGTTRSARLWCGRAGSAPTSTGCCRCGHLPLTRDRPTCRARPNFKRFIITGAVLGLLVGIFFGLRESGGPSYHPEMHYDDSAAALFLGALGAFLGAGVGAGVAAAARPDGPQAVTTPHGETTPATTAARSGPLTGVRVVELAGIGPAPFAAMLLADLGADVIRDRPSGADAARGVDPARGRRPAPRTTVGRPRPQAPRRLATALRPRRPGRRPHRGLPARRRRAARARARTRASRATRASSTAG